MVLGSSRRVSSLIDFLSPHVLLADPTLPLPPAPTPGGMRALAHLAGQGDRTVHGARLAARRADGGWWLESDNPEAGAVDSRRFGAVPGPLIEGRVLVRYWRARSLLPNGPGIRPANENGPAGRRGRSGFLRELSDGGLGGVPPRRPAC